MADLTDGATAEDSRLWNWLIIFLLVGVAIRLVRYSLGMPIWGDEAFVGVNILDRDYKGLLEPLGYGQVAPIGFLWSQRAMYEVFGISEYATRLLPTLAGTAALFVLAYWARLLTNPLAAAISVGILAVGNYPVSRCVELKPYAGDLLISTLLLLAATRYVLDQNRKWLVWLSVLAPIAIFFSYPAVFTTAAIALLFIIRARKAPKTNLSMIVTFCVVAAASFLLIVLPVSLRQYKTSGSLMVDYWKEGFPPDNPIKFLGWLVTTHTGNLFAYPFGGNNGASTLNFLLAVVGLVVLFRSRPRAVGWLLILPFMLTFAASVLRRYPYGHAERISQHLAPAAILLIGLGTAALLQRISNLKYRRWAERCVFGALLLFGAGITAKVLLHPYSSLDVLAARTEARDLMNAAGSNGTIAVLQPPDQVEVIFQWYMHGGKAKIIWNAADDRSWLATKGPLWVVNTQDDPTLESRLQSDLERKPISHLLRKNQLGPRESPPDQWEVFAFAAVDR